MAPSEADILLQRLSAQLATMERLPPHMEDLIPRSLLADDSAAATTPKPEPTTYTTAGTVYKPDSAAPIQPPARKGRTLRHQLQVQTDLAMQSKPMLGGLESSPLARSPTTTASSLRHYAPLQQNNHRAVTPPAADERDRAPGSDPSDALATRLIGISPAVPRLGPPQPTAEDARSLANLELGIGEDDDNSAAMVDKLAAQFNVKALTSLASYNHPHQRAAQHALARARGTLKPPPRLTSPTPQRFAYDTMDLANDRGPAPVLLRGSHSAVQTARASEERSQLQGLTARALEPSANPSSLAGVSSQYSLLSTGPGAPRPLTAGPPGLRQYRPSTLESAAARAHLPILDTGVKAGRPFDGDGRLVGTAVTDRQHRIEEVAHRTPAVVYSNPAQRPPAVVYSTPPHMVSRYAPASAPEVAPAVVSSTPPYVVSRYAPADAPAVAPAVVSSTPPYAPALYVPAIVSSTPPYARYTPAVVSSMLPDVVAPMEREIDRTPVLAPSTSSRYEESLFEVVPPAPPKPVVSETRLWGEIKQYYPNGPPPDYDEKNYHAGRFMRLGQARGQHPLTFKSRAKLVCDGNLMDDDFRAEAGSICRSVEDSIRRVEGRVAQSATSRPGPTDALNARQTNEGAGHTNRRPLSMKEINSQSLGQYVTPLFMKAMDTLEGHANDSRFEEREYWHLVRSRAGMNSFFNYKPPDPSWATGI